MASKRSILEDWMVAQKRHHLTDMQVQMARELGFKPDSLRKIDNHKQESWKTPLPQHIENLYEKRFKREKPEIVKSLKQLLQEDVIKREAKKKAKDGRRKAKQEAQAQIFKTMKNFKPAAWLLPQPVLIIGTYDADGTPNAMNAAWSGHWDAHEIMISLGSHATTDNLNRCGEFTVSFATVDTLAAADFVGIVSGRKQHDKIAKTGWNAVKADHVNAPIFTNLPMTMECRVKEKINESETGFYLIGEIVNIVCDEKYLAEDGKPDVEKMRLITFDPIHNGYIELGKSVGKAFHDGMALK